ncbi:hypothetical protein MCEMSEM22_00156 [Comamonadaceae bacterium]
MNLLRNHFMNRVLHKTLWATLLPLCALWSLGQTILDHSTTRELGTPTKSFELPTEWQGTPLRPLALSEVELRFTRHFPGTLARMTDGHQVLVLRTVTQPTRMLHPATDCYRGLGYRIRNEQLEEHTDKTRWRCFIAERGGRAVRVCERIEDAQGQGFTDTSAWYWASAAGQSTGPWKAITVATPL